ncbi:hypothetical protein B9Z55_009147 [Caenorhabditis nigoni]|uniref:Serpentine receptor class gamma n=1 Tax=Caenorhabditis nigoni TaxID=1611254 RepID=A0A2G5UR74_9PELO|nr:hypothetical protein B9Z55_009147 [Caenorhabditis nigoni]
MTNCRQHFFQEWRQHAWYSGGYVDSCPPKCDRPIQYCFDRLHSWKMGEHKKFMESSNYLGAKDCQWSNTIIQIFLDISAVRLFLYVPQLCPTFSKIFIKYKFLNHIIFPIYNYCRVFKAVSQSAHILVRYSCVTNILTHEQKTSKKIPLIMGIIGFLPVLVIWNTVISEKEVVFWYGGFFTVYHRYVQWASLSFLHLIFLLVAISIILLTSLLIYRELDEHQVMNSIQKSLIINTGFVIFALMLQAIFQSYYALFRHYSWFPMYFIDFQFLIYDVMTVGCPILMLIFAQNFRAHTMFGPRSKATNASQHYPFQPFSEAIRKKTDDPPRPCNALIFSGIPE